MRRFVAIDKSIWRYIARATYRRAPELERTACGRQPERQGVAMTACICRERASAPVAFYKSQMTISVMTTTQTTTSNRTRGVELSIHRRNMSDIVA